MVPDTVINGFKWFYAVSDTGFSGFNGFFLTRLSTVLNGLTVSDIVLAVSDSVLRGFKGF